jgi:4-azaleucine resistance transporter AzlC
MNRQTQLISSIKDGFISALPLIFGFFPVAMAFGLLAKNTGISLQDTSLFSVMVFAGASQFMALDMIKDGIAAGSIILATFLLNLRHLIMSASLSVRFQAIKKRWLPVIAFGITDEAFSLISLRDKPINVPFLLTLQITSYSSWVAGTIAGYLVGTLLPETVQLSLGVGLYAMFMALLAPELKKSLTVVFLAVMSGGFYLITSYFELLPASWCFIAAVILAAGIGALVIKDKDNEVVKDQEVSA